MKQAFFKANIHHFLHQFLLCYYMAAGRVARELWWTNQFSPVDIILSFFFMLIHITRGMNSRPVGGRISESWSHPVDMIVIIINIMLACTPRLIRGLFPSDFRTKILHVLFLISPVRVHALLHVSLFLRRNNISWSWFWSSLLYNFYGSEGGTKGKSHTSEILTERNRIPALKLKKKVSNESKTCLLIVALWWYRSCSGLLQWMTGRSWTAYQVLVLQQKPYQLLVWGGGGLVTRTYIRYNTGLIGVFWPGL